MVEDERRRVGGSVGDARGRLSCYAGAIRDAHLPLARVVHILNDDDDAGADADADPDA